MGAVMLFEPINVDTLPQDGLVSGETGIREILVLPERLAISVSLWMG